MHYKYHNVNIRKLFIEFIDKYSRNSAVGNGIKI